MSMKDKVAILIILTLISIYTYRINYNNNKIKIVGGLVNHHIYLRPGETGKTEFVIYTAKTGRIKFEAYEVSGVGDTRKIESEVVVRVIPSEAELKPNENVFRVIVKTYANSSGSHTFLIRAIVDGKTIEDWLRVLVAKSPNPCFASLYPPEIEHPNAVKVKAGESAEVNIVLHTRESQPGIVRFTVYRVKEVYEKKEIPMPNGLSVEVIPSERLVSPHGTYIFKLRISSDSSLRPGRYVFCINFSGAIGRGWSWITVNVI